ncbi:MAG: response regulator [Kofleriaceae bacterium]|nr:response regulator [Kofleriaceae bacterium]
MKLLLVEDNHADARLFAELLTEVPGRPFKLTTVGTFAAALPVVAQQDVVFLDLSLPDAHGIETVNRMVRSAGNLPIVVLTGNADDRIAVEAMKAGAQDFLVKSEISPALIARAARYAVERKHAEENAKRLAKSDEAARRARFLSSLTEAITSSFDLDKTLPDVARLLVPTLGDFIVIDLLHEGGRFERLATAACEGPYDDWLQAAFRYAPGDAHPRSPVLKAVERRESMLFEAIDVGYLAPDDDYRRLAEKHDLRSMFVWPLVARGRVVGAITSLMGPSKRTFDAELRRLAEEVGERIALGIDNARLYQSAQRAIRGRDELLAVVSHDLRNPLNIVALALQAVAGDPEMMASALPRALRGVDRMQRLIEDLLDVARIESGTLQVDLRPIDVTTIIEDAFEQHRGIAADKRITLVREFDRTILGAHADRHRLSQAIANLVANAFKFTAPGGTIRIGGEERGERVALWIGDTGPGIPPEHLAHIFDRFWQPKRGGRDGVGLGLAIVKGIVDAHNGVVEVDSVPGAGTTFRVLLDRCDVKRASAVLSLVH